MNSLRLIALDNFPLVEPDDNLINFTIVENDNEIDVFFDNETFNLVGWKTRDIYQNTNITYLSSIETNKEITKNLFKIPSQN